MADVADDEGSLTVTRYYAYCPYGTECSKGNATLGGFSSEARARWAVQNHLACSPYHNFTEDMAAMEAEIAELKEEEVPADDADWEAPASKPPEPKGQPPSKRRRTTRALPSTASGSQTPGDAAEQGAGVVANLDQAFARQTRSAMAFTKAMPRTKKKQDTTKGKRRY
jgi:hypothetical protein